MATKEGKRSAKDLGEIEDIDRFIIAYREQRNLMYLVWRKSRFGIPIPKIYRKQNRGKK